VILLWKKIRDVNVVVTGRQTERKALRVAAMVGVVYERVDSAKLGSSEAIWWHTKAFNHGQYIKMNICDGQMTEGLHGTWRL